MFLERLSRLSSRIEDTQALSLVAKDGIPVESLSSSSELDLESLAAELIAQARAISDDHRELSVGEVQQFSVTTDRYTFLVSAVTPEYYLLLVLGKRGIYGKARFELRRARLQFEGDLS
jgi:predicted regulator of Ras-like GTPase activity (Roadblock/LC7/MglB family)